MTETTCPGGSDPAPEPTDGLDIAEGLEKYHAKDNVRVS
jgi:hypothetical protein